jgi:hypothetical protein
MKNITKLLLAGTALAAGGVANAAVIGTLPFAPGGSDIYLFVTASDGNSFVQDLGVNVDSLGVTTASVTADAAAGREYSVFGNIGTPGVLGNVVGTNGADAALQTFLANNAGSSFYYGMVGAAAGNGSQSTGQGRFVAGYTAAFGAQQFGDEPTTSNVSNAAQQTNAWFQGLNLGTATAYNAANGLGQNAVGSFASTSGRNGAALGTTLFLYELANYTDSTGIVDANVYADAIGITVSTTGVISGLSAASGGTPVPLPAAVWLLGSGLLGLFGIGRRRAAVQA